MNKRDPVAVRHTLRLTFLFVLALSVCAPAVLADEACSEPTPECAVVGKWEISAALGVGQRSNPVAGRSDIPLVVIPRISYYGKRFFLENLELGVTLHETASNAFNLIAAPGYDRVFFYRSDLQNVFIAGGIVVPVSAAPPPEAQEFPVRSRRTTYLVGPEWTFGYGALSGQVNALREVTGRHDGYEVRAALAAALPAPKGSLVASGGLTWKSAEIVRYYYGVDELYEPGAAFNPFLKVRYTLPLSTRWSLNAFVHYEQLADSIADSPVVSERHVTTFFAGVVFRVY